MSEKQTEFGNFLKGLIDVLADVSKVPDVPATDLADENFKALRRASLKIQELEATVARERAYARQLTKTIGDERELYGLAIKDIQIRDDQIGVLEELLEELQEENKDLRAILQDGEPAATIIDLGEKTPEEVHAYIDALVNGGEYEVEPEVEELPEPPTSVFKDFYEETRSHNTTLLLNIVSDLQQRVVALEKGRKE